MYRSQKGTQVSRERGNVYLSIQSMHNQDMTQQTHVLFRHPGGQMHGKPPCFLPTDSPIVKRAKGEYLPMRHTVGLCGHRHRMEYWLVYKAESLSSSDSAVSFEEIISPACVDEDCP